jgi:hypothetical protein
MRPISRREGIWIENVSELDLPEDILYYSDYISNSPLIFLENTEDTLVISDIINSDEFESSVDTLLFSDVASADDYAISADTLLAYETLWLTDVETPTLSETLVVSDSIDSFYSTVTVDAVVVSDTLAGRLAITGSLANTLTASDSIAAGLAGVSTDTVVVSDSSATATATAIADSLYLTDVATARLAISAATVDTLIASDEIGYGSIQSTANTVVVSDSIAGTVSVASPVLLDTIVISETLAGPVAIYAAVLTDTVAVSDALIGTLALVGVLSDTVLFGDTIADAAYQTLIIVNAETGAVSTYTMTPVVAGLAEYRGTLYLAGPNGLYAMDATEDEDGEVVWALRTGFSNLGTDLLKRVRDVNVQGRTEGDTLFKVVSARGGEKQEWHYQLTEATRDAYRDGVVKVGRGITSVYWQFALQGTGPAEIDQLRVSVEPLSRRR